MSKFKKKTAAIDKLQPIHESKKNNKQPAKPSVITAVDDRASKQATLIALLEHPDGATIDDLASRLGWQPDLYWPDTP